MFAKLYTKTHVEICGKKKLMLHETRKGCVKRD